MRFCTQLSQDLFVWSHQNRTRGLRKPTTLIEELSPEQSSPSRGRNGTNNATSAGQTWNVTQVCQRRQTQGNFRPRYGAHDGQRGWRGPGARGCCPCQCGDLVHHKAGLVGLSQHRLWKVLADSLYRAWAWYTSQYLQTLQVHMKQVDAVLESYLAARSSSNHSSIP